MKTSIVAPSPRRSHGFSMIELLGVLALVAILAAVIAPNMVGELDRTAQQLEEQDLRRIAVALEQHVLQHRALPDQTTWLSAVASETGRSTNWVAVNPRGGRRVLLIDPRFAVGPNGTSKPPFTQTAEGSVLVAYPRYLLLSSMGQSLPVSLVSGYAQSNSAFDEIWNLTDGSTPAGWSWSGNGSDLKVQRLDLTPDFHQVTLNSIDLLPGRYSVDSSAPVEVTRSPISFFLIGGSVVGLVGTDGVAQSREVIDRTTSFSFEAGIWRGQLFAGIPVAALTGSELEAVASSFLSSPDNTASGTTPETVYAAIQSYLSAYNAWALGGYPSSGSLRDAVVLAQTALSSSVDSLTVVP